MTDGDRVRMTGRCLACGKSAEVMYERRKTADGAVSFVCVEPPIHAECVDRFEEQQALRAGIKSVLNRTAVHHVAR